jgi:hypothetical protein
VQKNASFAQRHLLGHAGGGHDHVRLAPRTPDRVGDASKVLETPASDDRTATGFPGELHMRAPDQGKVTSCGRMARADIPALITVANHVCGRKRISLVHEVLHDINIIFRRNRRHGALPEHEHLRALLPEVQ